RRPERRTSGTRPGRRAGDVWSSGLPVTEFTNRAWNDTRAPGILHETGEVRPSPDPRRGIPAAPHRSKLSRHTTFTTPAGVAAPGMPVREAPGPKKSQTSGEPMNDQENQETQGSGQAVAEVQQEAPATSETTAVDQNVQASEDSAPEVQASNQPGEDPQAV